MSLFYFLNKILIINLMCFICYQPVPGYDSMFIQIVFAFFLTSYFIIFNYKSPCVA